MTVTIVTSRDFNQDTGRAKKAAEHGPVFITCRGRPSHVLLSVGEYERITQKNGSIVERLAMNDDIEFDPPRLEIKFQDVEFD